MSRIKGSNTKTEVLLQNLLRDLKIPFKRNYEKLTGKPDIYIPVLNLIIEINGCFWHGHENCRYFVMPKTNKLFWKNKIESNIARDFKKKNEFRRKGYKVCILWECEFKDGSFLNKLFRYI